MSSNLIDMEYDNIWECFQVYFDLRMKKKLTGFYCRSVNIACEQ